MIDIFKKNKSFVNLKNIVNFLLVLVVASYTETFKGVEKGYKTNKINFYNFLKHSKFPFTIMSLSQKIVTKFELWF